MIHTCTIGLVALFALATTGRSATIEIKRIRDDKATLVSETGETYFTVVVAVNALTSDRYSFGLSLGNIHMHSTTTNLSAGRHEITVPCYSHDLSRLSGPVSNVTVSIHSPPSGHPAQLTFQTSESQELSRIYTADQFVRRAARVKDATESYESIASSLAEITLPTQFRTRDRKYEHEAEHVDPTTLFGRSCESAAYKLFFLQLPMRDRCPSYVAVSETMDTGFVVDNLDAFNRYAATLAPAPVGASQCIAQARAFMSICQVASNPTVLTEIPKSKRARPDHPKDMSVAQWFKKNKNSNPFHAPDFSRTEEAQTLRFFSWQGLVGIIRHHEYSMKPNGEIISHQDEELATWVGDWWIH